MRFANLICPVSAEKVDSSVSRLTAFLNVVLMGLFLATHQTAFIVAVALDYAIRAFGKTALSPLRWLAHGMVRSLRLEPKPVNAAPRVFASRLGVGCAAAASILSYAGQPLLAAGVTWLFVGLALLDSVFSLCVGCMIYHYVVFPFYKRSSGSA